MSVKTMTTQRDGELETKICPATFSKMKLKTDRCVKQMIPKM